MTASQSNHGALAEALRSRVLEGPGVTDRSARQAAADRASGGPPIAAAYDDLVRQIGASSHRVTSAQVERLVSEVRSQRGAFEIIAAAATGAGLLRWRLAIKALDEAGDASSGN